MIAQPPHLQRREASSRDRVIPDSSVLSNVAISKFVMVERAHLGSLKSLTFTDTHAGGKIATL